MLWNMPQELYVPQALFLYITLTFQPAASAATSIAQQGSQLANSHRSEAFAQHLKQAPTTNQLAHVSTEPTLPLTTAALDNFWNVGFTDADCIKIYAEPHVNGKLDQWLGSTTRAHPPTAQMDGKDFMTHDITPLLISLN